jgi:hypothetical protein
MPFTRVDVAKEDLEHHGPGLVDAPLDAPAVQAWPILSRYDCQRAAA